MARPETREEHQGRVKLQMYGRRMGEAATARMERLKDEGTTTNPATPRERELAAAWRWKSLSYGAVTWILAFGAAKIPPLPLSTLWSSAVATASGFFVTFGTFLGEAPKVVDEIIRQPGRSKIVDDFLCPSLFEMQPCLDDPECRQALDTVGAGICNGPQLAAMIRNCRERQRTVAPADDDAFTTPSGDFAPSTGGPGAAEQPDDDRWYTPPTSATWDFPDQEPPSNGRRRD
eukprot:CAMPEP_0118889200 /NCGR_PEP_ID=MMETSP1166-20130328/240_1 /TAXON_ID=1104430 /ORGANISM="Chrysoreinhardia sp, Strain CCMP3193" /LENGTH=231 /DNA_ID=CAMNT_0006827787 /DNA_START=120 /DNA_END=815 /DNA_ORIENTATION=-